MPAEKAVILCSGGLNSAVVTSLARLEHQPALLHVRFAHRAAKREAELFTKLADHFEIAQRLVVDMPHLGTIGGSARLARKRQIEDALVLGEGPSSCHVPGLISSLLSAAYSWASEIGAAKIFIGVSENLGPPAPPTRQIYPDHSREFIQLWNHLCGVASPRRPIAVEAPIIDLDRSNIIRLGQRLRTPLQLTWSCVALGTEPCGRCAGCATRQRGFLDAGIPDPIVLERAVPL